MSEPSEDLILLVEDNDLDAMLMERVLNKLRPDIRVVRGEDGIVALDMLESCRPDLIIMDVRMPRMDGREALAQIKANEQLRRIPIIMMSTSRDEDDIAHCYHHHANAYVTKSSNPRKDETVENLVRFWLDTAEL